MATYSLQTKKLVGTNNQKVNGLSPELGPKTFANMLKLVFLVLPWLVRSAPVGTLYLPLDCEAVYNQRMSLLGKNPSFVPSGVYTIYPAGAQRPVRVYCDMGCADTSHQDGRWTVIQRRLDGNMSFYRPWQQYKEGFGDAKGEYWLGLENIFLLTYRSRYQLRVDMEDFEKGRAYAQYTSFYIDPESSKYRLHVSGHINGGAGDSLSHSSERDFSTFDKDSTGSCANTYSGGFWYNSWQCHHANPNGLYKWGNVASSYTGIIWYSWRGSNYSLKKITMKIRRVTMDDLKEL
ncbi:microfibril-associated glycoprotein 4-like [Trichomycterus rosablanca]|uniref:microfibril-associated glycoprotein 4-like n=1 Tax=Trichomycterus rosablanca TaxID=2290929 RepID=UPI002F355CA6